MELTSRLRNKMESAFWGKITSNFTHDIRNIQAIIKEYNGLLGDALFYVKKGRPLEVEKVERIQKSIARQLAKEQGIISCLNRVAHRVDKLWGHFLLKDVLLDMLKLSERIAKLASISLHADLEEDPGELYFSSFHLQHIFYRCMVCAIEHSKNGAEIHVETKWSESEALIKIISTHIVTKTIDLDEIDLIKQLHKEVGGSFNFNTDPNELTLFNIEIPLNLHSVMVEKGEV